MGVRMNLAHHANAIARALLGEPNRALSSKTQLRFGTKGSLAIEIAGEAAGSWFDHENGVGGGMLDLIQRQKGFSNGGALDWLRDIGIDLGPAKQTTVAEYIYCDRAGVPVFKVTRKGPRKQFFQARYDAATSSFVSGKGCMDGVRRVPYRLNEWADAEGTIVIPEGEKDVDRLRSLKLLATCNAGGAGNWSRGYAPYFQDRDVVILPDNDQAGRNHARDIADCLMPMASRVAILDLPGLQDTGDVSDWLDAGHNGDELRDLIQKAPDAATVLAEGGKAPPSSSPSDDWEQPLLEAVEELSAKHFVVTVGGQTVIATLARDDALGRELLVFSQERDIRLRYRHRHYLVGHTNKGAEIWKSLGEAWLAHRNRRNFERIALVPKGNVPADTFNLWRGLGVDPKRGDWPLIRQHLLDVICSGNASNYHWLIGWLARAVQYPEMHAEVAVVLHGLKGTGKGTLAQILHRMFRHHAMHISNPAHFTGRFNGHLIDVLFLFVDEAFWAGDKAGEGTLKALVTEPTIPIEPKFVNLFQTTNRLKILMASNADWVVPATADERRFFVLDVSDCKRGNREYFAKLHGRIDGAELPAFLEYLLKLDLRDFDHRNPPHTAALNRQKLSGADSLTHFWHDCLTNGEIVGTAESEWPEDIVVQVLHAAYVEHAHDHGDRRPLSDARMAEKLGAMMPDKILRRIRPWRPFGDNPRPHRYALAQLEDCRTAFLKAMRIDDYTWPELGK